MNNKLAICYPQVNSKTLIDQSLAGCYVPHMATIRTIRRRNFLSLLSRYETNREFADAVGRAPAFVSQIKTGRRNIGDDVARDIERAFVLPEGWFDVSHDEVNEQATAARTANSTTLTPVTGHRRTIPIISYIQAGEPKEVVDAYAAGNGETITVEGAVVDNLGVHAFALEIQGDSMLPDFRPGEVVVVDPDAPVRPGDIVVAKLDRDEKATLKKYRERGVDAKGWPIIELKPLNDDYAPVVMDADNPGKIIGPVVEHRRRLR